MRRILITVVVAVHVSLVAWGASRHSPTTDEAAYLAAGLSHWQFGTFDLLKVSPPLVRLVAAVPVLFASPQYDWGGYVVEPGLRVEHTAGHDFLVANGRRSLWLMTLARFACIPFTLIGAAACYWWAKEMFGNLAAFAALVLWCFSPNILAHAQLMTPDIGVTALSLAACYMFWRWGEKPSFAKALLVGGTVGLAVLAKTNAVALYPSLGLLGVVQLIRQPALRSRRILVESGLAFVFSIYVVNLGYGFEGSLRPLGNYQFFSKTFAGDATANRFRSSIVAEFPVPLPAAFLEGCDLQRRDFENGDSDRKSYLRGEWYDHGWWWYYLYVVAVKTPIGTWVLALLGTLALLVHSRYYNLACLVVPGLFLFGLASSQTGFSHSLRYVLPAFPFAFLCASAAFTTTSPRILRVAMFSLSWSVASSLFAVPHSLSYFNELAGGPDQGHAHLLDGNIDWGQNLLYLQEWIDNHPHARPVYVDYWGYFPLKSTGFDFNASQFREGESPPAGYYIVSVNFLRGEYRIPRPHLQQFLAREPVDRIGYTFYVYRVD